MKNTALDALIAWIPMLLLIAVWIFFMWQMKKQTRGKSGKNNIEIAEEHLAELRRQNDLLEKIVKDHDVRLQRLEATANR
jgi:ATP-dependent Zn protease